MRPSCFSFGSFFAAVLLASVLAPGAWAGEGEAKPAAGPVYLRLKPITFSVIGPDNRISRQIGILLQLQLSAGKTAEDGEKFRRQIEDRCLVTMTQLWDQRQPNAPPVSAELIKSRLLKVVNGVAGPDLVQGVYIQELSERSRSG